MNNSDFIDLLKRVKIAIFCAGLHGKLFYEILKACEIKVDCFIDNSEEKWGKTIIDDVLCVNPSVLSEKKYIVFVCVGRKYCKTITNEIVSNYQVEIYTITEFIDFLVQNNKELYFKVLFQHGLSESADLIFDVAANRRFVFRDKKVKFSSKIAVYTAVFGEYDSSNYCKNFGDGVDLFFVSDMKPKNLPEYYKWLDAKTIIPPNIESPIKRNRYIKMKPHNFLGQYEYSIYIDGNVIIEGDLASFIRKSKSGISVFMHPARECIYHEAISIVNFKRVNADDVCKQMKRYMDEGMPSHYGLSEMPIIAREHKKSECVSVMEKWWEEFEKESQRDQLSFMYAMWKNNLKISDLGCLGYDVRNYKYIKFFKHSKESKNIKNK